MHIRSFQFLLYVIKPALEVVWCRSTHNHTRSMRGRTFYLEFITACAEKETIKHTFAAAPLKLATSGCTSLAAPLMLMPSAFSCGGCS